LSGRVWLLNLDADLELAHGLGYQPRASVNARIAQFKRQIAPLWSADDRFLDGNDALSAGSWQGHAWCPTPSALELLGQAGASLWAAPSFEVLRRVNHRRFCAELGQTLEAAAFLDDMAALRTKLQQGTESRSWLLKRPFSISGSGRRRVSCGKLDAADLTWLVRSLKRDGLQVEPWVERLHDVVLHGFVRRDGHSHLGALMQQACSPQGVWQATVPLEDGVLSEAWQEQFKAEGCRVAEALYEAGYHGPFGLDAYSYRRGAQGRSAFNARCEINARYTMGWAVGMGSCRPDLDSELL